MSLALTRRGRIWYIRGSVRGQSVFESTRVSDEPTAEAIRAKREARLIEDSVFGAAASATFDEALVAYGEGGGSPRFLLPISKRFGARKLQSITQGDLDQAARELYPTANAETRNRQFFTPFIAVWNAAVRQRWAEPRQWQRPRKAKGTTAIRPAKRRAGSTPIDYETAARFVAAMSPAPAMVMTVAFYTGMRPIEIFALEAGDVDLAARWLVVRSSKTGEPRGVPLHSFLCGWLGPLVARGGALLRTPRGEPYPLLENVGGQIQSAILGARRRSGIAGVSPYTARHTVSTQLVIAGVHPHIKDQILGHAVDDMSRRYTSVPQAPLVEAIETLPVPAPWRALPWVADPVGWQRRLVEGTGARTDLRRKA